MKIKEEAMFKNVLVVMLELFFILIEELFSSHVGSG